MGSIKRRDFIKTVTAVGCTAAGLSAVTPKKLNATPENILSKDRYGVLVDTTVCIGCRRCEWACKKAHGIEAGSIDDYDDKSVFQEERRPAHDSYTVVNSYDVPNAEPVTVKVQCMHCDQPACVSACIVGAFSKKENGAVIWDESKCIGCRYCLVACPFQVPTFDYHKAIEPEIRKCDFCYERTSKGQLPACVEICPVEALTYGKRSDLLQIAHDRIHRNPDRYIDHILGETEVGGTSWMYLSKTEFSNYNFPKLGNSPAPGVSESIQHGIFAYFVPPIALYALLGGIMYLTKEKSTEEEK
ncbi:MAG: 4Fe-4S dicluster domain-containing protein [Melioribacteraceae bacterium]|nr:4Fe-4S dicluster domain-containing protein [Melioribacteraceae bacterium]